MRVGGNVMAGIARVTCLWSACICGAFALSVPAAPTNSVVRWNNGLLEGVRDAKLEAPTAARAVAIMRTCMYDAWAAYDVKAIGTQLSGALRRPTSERTLANKEKAVSYAAYR